MEISRLPNTLIINKLSGQYILRIDADDYVEPDFIKYYLSEIKENSPDIIYSDYNLVNAP